MATIGEINHRITLQYKTIVMDSMGGRTETWNTAATVWAKKTAHRSDEAVQAMKETGILMINYRIRYRADVRASWRIVDGGKYLAIIGPPIPVDLGPGRRFLDITAKETG
jgi:SPP1 family predicted phage head-tail adaptor